MLAGVASVLRCAPLLQGYMALSAASKDLAARQSNHCARFSVILATTATTTPTASRHTLSSPAASNNFSFLFKSAILFPPLRSNTTPLPLASAARLRAMSTDHASLLVTGATPQSSVSSNVHINATDSNDSIAPGATVTGGVVQVYDTITLTPGESELFDTLLEAARHAGISTVLRCAGGWVRDKLLGRNSDDIDIALDNMLGKDFADVVNEYLKAQGREARHAAVIQSNPDQSKHLETARMKIGEVWIDLVNLRSETYAADSRIPTMTFGTAEQDALRRDFTVNALFYNLTAGGVVEDLTGRGLQDLRDGLMRTPLPPLETFLDDPLRVLRAVRFGTRFNFRLHSDIMEAAASEQVRAALATKISKERVGTELEGMFNGPAPVEAVRLLHRLGLFPTVFALPPPLDSRIASGYGSPCCTTMAAADGVARALELQMDKDERRFLMLSALLLPLRNLTHTPPKGKLGPATAALIRDSLKWRVKDIEMTSALHEAAAELAAAHGVLRTGGGAASSDASGTGQDVRVVLGHVIRKLKQNWKLGVALAPVILMREAAPLGPNGDGNLKPVGSDGGGGDEAADETAAAARVEMARELLATVEAFGLADCWSWKPLMDGKKVMKILGWSKPGPQLGKVMAAVADWHLTNPEGTVAQAEEMVRDRFGAGQPEV